MPRNGSGTCSVSNSFSSGTTISSTAMNANFTDFASEITGSLPRDGQAAMTGQLKSASGSVSAPGVTFSADLDCGYYRIGADNIGFSIGGVKLWDHSSAAATITGALTATTTITGATVAATGAMTKGGVSVEAFASGTAMLFAQTSAPTGWTKSTTHNNKALRVVTGTASSGGSQDFTTCFATGRTLSGSTASYTLLAADIPSHQHFIGVDDGSTTNLSNSNYLGERTGGAEQNYNLAGTATVANIGLTSATGGGGGHSHTAGTLAVAMDVAYMDVIVAVKD
jgi:hypothetical protein